MNNEGVNVVGEDFMLATAVDIVADPSEPRRICGWNHGRKKIGFGTAVFFVNNKVAKTYKQINTLASSRQLQENKIKLFSDFLKNL